MNENKWLPHLSPEKLKGVQRYLCAYLVALEGWRRGLTLTWSSEKVKKRGIHAPGRLFTLSSDERSHEFYKTKGDKISKKALVITGNKQEAKRYFEESGVLTPEGRRFTKEIKDQEIVNYAKNLGYPVVLKPTNGYRGIGVVVNIGNTKELQESLKHVREELGYLDVLIERYIQGEEYRVFVVDDKVISVLWRIPANIIGDGVHTIQQLIRLKNKTRKTNPRLAICLIKIDREVNYYIEKEGFTLDSVLPENQQLFLRENSNISTGGDSIEMLEEFPSEFKQVAINSLKSIPNLPHGGVDILVEQNKPVGQAANVIEINAIPQIGSLVFPMIGEARDVPSAIIDYYFPETKDDFKTRSNVYFDLREVLRPLMSKVANEITITPAPLWKDMDAAKYNVKGKVQNVGYRNWIRKKALEHDLCGHVRNLNNGTVEVVVAGEIENVKKIKTIIEVGPAKAEVEDVTVTPWEKAINVGFEIKENQKVKTSHKIKPKQPVKPIRIKKVYLKNKIKNRLKKIIRKQT